MYMKLHWRSRVDAWRQLRAPKIGKRFQLIPHWFQQKMCTNRYNLPSEHVLLSYLQCMYILVNAWHSLFWEPAHHGAVLLVVFEDSQLVRQVVLSARGCRFRHCDRRLREWGRGMSEVARQKVSNATQMFGFGFINVQLNLQVDHGGQLLYFVDFIFEVPQCCPFALWFIPNLQLPKQNRADGGTSKL